MKYNKNKSSDEIKKKISKKELNRTKLIKLYCPF